MSILNKNEQINHQFGGGCPICKGNNTLITKGNLFKSSVECNKCGSVFKSSLGNYELIEGDSKYLGKKMSLDNWKKIRKGMIDNKDAKTIEEYLTEEESILAKCKSTGTNITFYATDKRIINVAGKDINHLDYSNNTTLSEAKERLSIIASSIGSGFFGLFLAAAMGAGFVSTPGFLFLLPILFILVGIVGIIVGIIGIKYYQFESPKINRTEKARWKIKNPDDESVKNFVTVVKKQLKTSVEDDETNTKEKTIETSGYTPEIPEVSEKDDGVDEEIIYSKDPEIRDFIILAINGFFPGIGTIIHGEKKRGTIQVALFIFGLVTSLVLIGLLIVFVVWIWALGDAVCFILNKELIFKEIGSTAK